MGVDIAKTFSWKPLGGLGEVGMNCMIFRMGEVVLPVDCGILFADGNNFGVEAVFPDFTKLISEGKVNNWLITHAHEDHIGALPHLFMLYHKMGKRPPVVWAPPFAHALICNKFQDERYSVLRNYTDFIKPVEMDRDLIIEGVRIRFIEVRHSTLDCCSLALTAEIDGKSLRVFHSADFKIDFNEFEDGTKTLKSYDCFGGKRPHVMFLDSTNADRPGQSVSESEILEPIESLIRGENNRVFVTLFSSNVYRLAALVMLAERCGRKVCISGRSMQSSFRIAREIGAFDKLPPFSQDTLVNADVLSTLPDSKQMVLCSGSQGELRSVLSKVSQESHPDFCLHEGDLVLFSSKLIPGNEKSVFKLINNLMRAGARVLWADRAKEAAGGPVHASGHARAAELRTLLDHLQPDHLFPVHGQRFQLQACYDIAKELSQKWPHELKLHLNENDDEVVFSAQNKSWEICHRFPGDPYTPRFLRHERCYSPSRDEFLVHKKRAALAGVVSIVVNSYGAVKVVLRGVYPEFLKDEAPFESLSEDIEDFVRSLLRGKRAVSLVDPNAEDIIESELKRYLRRVLGTRPLVVAHVVDK